MKTILNLKQNSKKLFKILFLSLIGFTIISGCDKKSENQKNGSNENAKMNNQVETANNVIKLSSDQVKNLNLTFTKLQNLNLETTLKLNGKIDVPSESRHSVSIPQSGIIKEFNLTPGQQVKKGQKLITIQESKIIEIQKEYLLIKNQLKANQTNLNRIKELYQLKASSDKELQDLEYQNSDLKVRLKSIEEQLKLIGLNPDKINENNIQSSYSIYSPINGFVASINTNVGKYANLGDILIELIRNDDIHLVLEAYDNNVNDLKIGQNVKVYSINNDKKYYRAKIISINKSLSQNNIVDVHCHINNLDNEIIVGKFMYGIIELINSNKNVIENSAIIDYENNKYIFIQKGENLFEKIEIKVGLNNSKHSEILTDQKLNLKNFNIVNNGAYYLLMEENK